MHDVTAHHGCPCLMIKALACKKRKEKEILCFMYHALEAHIACKYFVTTAERGNELTHTQSRLAFAGVAVKS